MENYADFETKAPHASRGVHFQWVGCSSTNWNLLFFPKLITKRINAAWNIYFYTFCIECSKESRLIHEFDRIIKIHQKVLFRIP